MSRVEYTRHAQYKFEMLRRHGFEVTPHQVEQTILSPERIVPQPGGRFLAQRQLTEEHILRVIYREEGDKRIVITFYPGRRDRYASPL